MHWYQWITLSAVVACTVSQVYQLYRLYRLGLPSDYAPPAGNSRRSTVYSFTGAMSPARKESAYLHLPTYISGLIYHLGIFLSFGLFCLIWIGAGLPETVRIVVAACLSVPVLCGFGILVKRVLNKGLRGLSNPDDYLSNILVTGFQLLTIMALVNPGLFTVPYFMFVTMIFLYIPLGKLQHFLFFFAARLHLGLFFGNRGVWPPEPNNKYPS
jgi:hypothetical protein